MQSIFGTLVAALAATAAVAPIASAQLSYSFLKDERAAGTLAFVPYSDAQKQQTIQQVSNLLDIWVNYRFKLSYYKDQRRVDPFPKVARIKSSLASLTTEQMHLALASTFNNVRDGHTNYQLPGPYRCFAAHTGIFYTFADSPGDNIATRPKVVVRSFTTRPGIVKLLEKELSQISIGDELVTYNGHTFMEFYNTHVWTAGGANTFGGMRSVLFYMSARAGQLNEFPKQDSVDIVFRSHKTGNNYQVTIPFVTVRDDACWAASSAVYANVTGQPLVSTKLSVSSNEMLPIRPEIDTIKYPMGMRLEPILDLEASTAAEVIAPPVRKINSVTMNPTKISSMLWGIYQPEGKNLGIIRLDDFVPISPSGAPDSKGAVELFRNLLVNELKDTNALIIDIRSNGGGLLDFANGIPQLFKPEFHAMGAVYLRNDINKRIFVDNITSTDSFHQAYVQSSPNDYYTKLGHFETFSESNQYGQAYLKPVGVFTDGNCYSSCDLLSSSFGNARIGPVFGEDGQTGGGGANVFEHRALVQLNPTDFQPLPFFKEMSSPMGGASYAHGMRVGIRAMLRNGHYKGKVIEDFGAATDYVIRPRLEDITPNATSSTQLDRIADKLFELGAKSGRNGLYFVLEPQEIEVTNGTFSLTAEVAGLDNLIVFDSHGKHLASAKFKNSMDKQKVTLQVQSPIKYLGNTQIYVESFRGSKRILKTLRKIRVVPEDPSRHNLVQSGFKWDLGAAPFIGIYNTGSAAEKPALGWRRKGDSWIIGDGINYAHNMNTDLRFFFTAPAGTNLAIKFKATYDTEPNFDFLMLNYDDEKATFPLLRSVLTTPFGNVKLPGVSGLNGTIDETFKIKSVTDKFAISLDFISDPAVSFRGVTVTEFSVTKA